MAELQSTNVQGSLCVNGVAIGGGKDFKYCCFTASSTFTPSQDLVDGDGALNVLAVGGGGAAGALAYRWCCGCNDTFGSTSTGGSPGGGAASFRGWAPIDSTDACTVTVGAGGPQNSISFNGTCTATCLINGTAGGNSGFGANIDVAGGGHGQLCAVCCKGGANTTCTRCCVAASRNGGCYDTYGGGAQSFTYAYCYYGKDGPFCAIGGSTGNQSLTNLDNSYDWTGSTNYGMFSRDCLFGNLGTGNPDYYGAGGNAPILGGKANCRDYLLCVNSTDGAFCNITQSREIPTRFYGAGANGYRVRLCNCNDALQTPVCVEVQGAQGNDGIVVLTWYE